MLKIVSPTGCVHAVDDTTKSGAHHTRAKLYSTLCNHAGWRYQYYHQWKETVYQVSCKRCLHVMNKKIEYKETGWTRARRFCEHRYPHLKHGVLCNESAKFRAEVAMRKCKPLLCPIPDVPAPHMMVKELVLRTIAQIGKDLIQAEEALRMRFNMVAVHCPRREPAIQKKSHAHMCSDPLLSKRDKDSNFGWACVMANCPHMSKALLWRRTNKEE